MGLTTRRLLVVSAILCVLAVLVAAYLSRNNIAVRYHHWRMMFARKKAVELGHRDPHQYDFIQSFDYHRDALVDLGFYERREFPLRNISVPSLASRRLWEELCAVLTDDAWAEMPGYEPETEDMIVVWDRPENIRRSQEIIEAHDRPAAPNAGEAYIDDGENLERFAGKWADSDGNLLYVIARDPAGRMKIKTPSNDAWRVEIKNVRLREGKLAFDQYHYTEAKDEFKTPISSHGHHPFSGVRCQTTLELNPENPAKMTHSVKTVHAAEPVLGTLTRMKSQEVAE